MSPETYSRIADAAAAMECSILDFGSKMRKLRDEHSSEEDNKAIWREMCSHFADLVEKAQAAFEESKAKSQK